MTEVLPKKLKVLVVDDELHMRQMLRVCLERNGYEVSEAASGDAGLAMVVRGRFDLVLLDLGLPDIDGLEVLKRLREVSKIPVLVVSVRGQEDDKISALDGGANDYITKPFSAGELLARLRVIERYEKLSSPATHFKTGELEVDLVGRIVTMRGRRVKLTATEYALLLLFVQHAGKPLTQGYLLDKIWNIQDSEKAAPLRVCVGDLREKLETDPARPELLITEAGVGYRLVLGD